MLPIILVLTCLSPGWRPPCWVGQWRGTCPSSRPTLTPTAPSPPMQPEHSVKILFLSINQVWKYWNRARFHHVLYTSKIASNWGLHCSRFLRPMWRKERRSFSFTCGCRSWRETLSLAAFFNCAVDFTWKQFLIFFKISGFNCETMDPPVHESFEVPERKKYNQNLLIRTGYRMSQL